MPCQPVRSLPLKRAVKPFGGALSAAEAHAAARRVMAMEGSRMDVILETLFDDRDAGGFSKGQRPAEGVGD